MLSLYSFDGYKQNNSKSSVEIKDVVILTQSGKSALLQENVKAGAIYGSGTNYARTLVNLPPNILTATKMAEYAKANDKVMVVTGYADSNTGSAEYNQKLSEKRANAVAEQLVKMGVDRNKIEVVAKGGVYALSPISYNRRVVVTMK